MDKRSCLKILIFAFSGMIFLCASAFCLEKNSEQAQDGSSFSMPAPEPDSVKAKDRRMQGAASGESFPGSAFVGDSRFPIKGRPGMPSAQRSIRNSMNSGSQGKGLKIPGNDALTQKTDRFESPASGLSPEKLRAAYTAGYARVPVSPYAGIPRRMRNAEPSFIQTPEWNEKYRKNSFKGSRPIPLTLNPSLMNASANPNSGLSETSPKGRNPARSVVIEKNSGEGDADKISSAAADNLEVPVGGTSQDIRILLRRTSGGLSVETSSGLLVSGGDDGISVTRIKGKMTFSAKGSKIFSGDEEISDGICQIKPSVSSLKLDGKAYRGSLVLHAEGNTILAVNHLPMEAYLLGVVPAEMPASWSEEALKAQAVASRSYAFFHMQDAKEGLWDLEDTEVDQVYGGKDSEKPKTTLAIYATKGQVILYGGRPAEALFHADSGGYTDSPGDVWKKDYPYLRSINDKFTSAGGPFTWEYFVASDRFFSRLRGAGIKAGNEDEVRIAEKTKSGRVQQVAVGDSFVSGTRLRQLLNPEEMKSAKYDVKECEGGFLFYGKGYGHGVGLSQNGARQMAEMGYSYKDILKFYYRGVCIGRMSAILYAARENPYRKKEIYQ